MDFKRGQMARVKNNVIPNALGVLCIGVSILYLIVWPKRALQGRGSPLHRGRIFILRWFHSLVWATLALACFAWANSARQLATALCVTALLTYVTFLVTLIATRNVAK